MNLQQVMKEAGLPLSDVVGDGALWQLGEPAVTVTTVCERRGEALVIRHRLHNPTAQTSAPIGPLTLLRLTLRHPGPNWELLAARGGTTENYYPPSAYETRRLSGIRHFKIRSHTAGRSSNKDLPLLIGCAIDRHEGFFCGFEWSAHWSWEFSADAAQGILTGRIPVSGLTLAAGETLELPAVHLGFYRGDLDDGTNALRRYLYEQVCPRYLGQPVLPPVSYDSWFGLENNGNSETLKAEVDRAAELGVEVFVHDAAWFAGGFPAGVGNWDTVDPVKWPDGLEPLAEHVRSTGMQFGLWFEIERAAPGTAAVREHPELFVETPQTHCYGGCVRTQFHLNLARRDAQDWAIETVSGWIRRLDVRWSRFDYNLEPWEYWNGVDPTGKIQFAYMAGLYRMLDVLMERHPGWFVETCASGGRRLDLGTLRRAHTAWFSDETVSPRICRWMQARANRFLPGHLLNSSVAVGLRAGDAGFDETAILSRMLGKLSFDGDIASWSPVLTARAAALVKRFKALRHLLVQDFYQLLPIPRDPAQVDAVQFSSYDGREHVVFAFAGSEPMHATLALRGLRSDARYTVDPAPVRWDGAGLEIRLAANTGGMWHVCL